MPDDIEAALERILPFVVAGFRAPAPRRKGVSLRAELPVPGKPMYSHA